MLKVFSVFCFALLVLSVISYAQIVNIPVIEQSSITDTVASSIVVNGVTLDFSSPKINDYLRQSIQSFEGDVPLIVQFEGRLTSSQKSQLSSLGSIKYDYTIIPASALSIDKLKIPELASLSFVKSIELDAVTRSVLAQSTTQIGASRVWLEFGEEGEGVKIAILDTGIDNEHADLKNVVFEHDFTGEGTDDNNGHGTHVASIAAGSGSLSGGLNKGVAPRASLMDIKVLNSLGTGVLSDTIAGIQFAVINDADIISMSLGAEIPCNGLDATSLAADAAVKQGVHVVAAAGNTGPLPGTIGSPGCANDVVTVGAVDRLDNIAVFSSRGPTLDGRVKPDLVAPGVLILAAQSGGTYTAKSGTSMATPHVSGAIALMLGSKSGLSPQQIKSVLKQTAVDIGEELNTQGSGRIDVYSAFLQATGLEPEQTNESETTKEEAVEKSREAGVEKVNTVRDKPNHFVVEGEKVNETVLVWVNKGTGNIDKVEIIGVLEKIWLVITDFFDWLFSLFG